jgi:hypothetical protein
MGDQSPLFPFSTAVMRQPTAIGAREQTLQFVGVMDDRFRPDFCDWLADNWHIWCAFVDQANRVWASGRTHYSARTILHWLRHESAVRETEGAYKINNNVSPDFARLYEMIFDEREGFFEMRGRGCHDDPTPAQEWICV